jgi:hypothetical protein
MYQPSIHTPLVTDNFAKRFTVFFFTLYLLSFSSTWVSCKQSIQHCGLLISTSSTLQWSSPFCFSYVPVLLYEPFWLGFVCLELRDLINFMSVSLTWNPRPLY